MITNLKSIALLCCLMAVVMLSNSCTKHSCHRDGGPVQSDKVFVDQLVEGESYTIVYSSSGCFEQTTDNIVITRNANEYTGHVRTVTKTLTTTDLNAIRDFETYLRSNQFANNCTTVDTYNLTLNGTTYGKTDGSCNWGGGYSLLHNVFGL